MPSDHVWSLGNHSKPSWICDFLDVLERWGYKLQCLEDKFFQFPIGTRSELSLKFGKNGNFPTLRKIF